MIFALILLLTAVVIAVVFDNVSKVFFSMIAVIFIDAIIVLIRFVDAHISLKEMSILMVSAAFFLINCFLFFYTKRCDNTEKKQ